MVCRISKNDTAQLSPQNIRRYSFLCVYCASAIQRCIENPILPRIYRDIQLYRSIQVTHKVLLLCSFISIKDYSEMYHASRWHHNSRFHSPMAFCRDGVNIFICDCVGCINPVFNTCHWCSHQVFQKRNLFGLNIVLNYYYIDTPNIMSLLILHDCKARV